MTLSVSEDKCGAEGEAVNPKRVRDAARQRHTYYTKKIQGERVEIAAASANEDKSHKAGDGINPNGVGEAAQRSETQPQ